MRILPRDFWTLTPGEFAVISAGRREGEEAGAREEWRRTAWLAAQIINISGKYVRSAVKDTDLIQFPETDDERETRIDLEERRRQALEDIRYHKRKAWTLIEGASVEEVDIPPVGESGNVVRDDDAAAMERLIRE